MDTPSAQECPESCHQPDLPESRFAKNSCAIAFHQVSKVYSNGTTALQEMNLKIAESEFISLVGPSGCGKSTALRIMAGLGEASSGEIAWGAVQADVKAARKFWQRPFSSKLAPKLAFVFQEAALMPWATVLENVRLPLQLVGMSKLAARAAVAEAIALVGLKGFEQAYPRELSGGMKMRVSIARALVTQPDVLLMDEPFGALDEMTRSKLNSDLLSLWSQKRWTVVFVTHNIYEAVYLSNRVVVMAARPGRVVAEVEVAVPYPRTEEFRLSSLFNEYCREVSGALSLGAGF
ncbi:MULTISPECIES: ABC transporter ATP-binding protein [Trichocoleus]|uniref:ABC transporter ATP-binding protein n=1 Tax=Trichocoleus desertorum GB2-A4 TaxID=2933944 RepID=A0ABV0J593_9CYAN|nr:ABC transporter ATP-binding protein [Trichocoleus sp. FACHB-46]MBD1863782.1 ABC transporter ATP-binding protein [Trichocoleus sp. FACHB-46]